MLVKKIGRILFLKLKLYKLIKTLTLPLIILCLVLPFSEWNMNQFKQKYDFQEPSLKTKIFELSYKKSKLKENINYQKISSELRVVVFHGKLLNQCILITYPEKISQSNQLKILFNTLKNDKNLSKNVVLLSYKEVQSLRELFQGFLNGKIENHFGIIRVALNIDTQIRTKEKDKENDLKAYLQIYGKGGLHSDVDNFQSLKELLEQLHVLWSPCRQIHMNKYLKSIKKSIYFINSHFGRSKSQISTLVDHLLCQSYSSFTNQYQKGHETLMDFGFQSSSVTFLTFEFEQQTQKQQTNQKIAKFVYSFVKQYLFQQGHLHSSATFFYPMSNCHYLSHSGTVIAGLILLIVGLTNMIGYFVQNSQTILSTISIFNVFQVIAFSVEYRNSQELDLSLIYIGIKFVWKMVKSIFLVLKRENKKKISLQFIILGGISFLISLYFSIFNFPVYHLSGLMSSLMLIRKKNLMVFIIWITIVSVFMQFDFNKITQQKIWLMFFEQNIQQRVKVSLQQIIKSINSINVQVIIAILPIFYGIPTFLL